MGDNDGVLEDKKELDSWEIFEDVEDLSSQQERHLHFWLNPSVFPGRNSKDSDVVLLSDPCKIQRGSC